VHALGVVFQARFYITMCQLLGMNCATPTDFVFSFKGFARRGGATDCHQDGWGLVFYEGRGVRAFHDPSPAAKSPIADLVSNYPCKTLNMIAHIRYATSGACLLENVHPFQRELFGIIFSFAHNGDVPSYKKSNNCSADDHKKCRLNQNIYTPVGSTDSEAVFCTLLNELRNNFTELPTLPVLYEFLRTFNEEIIQSHNNEVVIFNYLLSCGENILFAFSWPGSRPGSKVWNGLYYLVRSYPFRMAKLKDCDLCVDFSQVTTPNDRVAVVATSPLTEDEVWTEFDKGQLIMFDRGIPHLSSEECAQAEREGRGLKSNFY
jgi:predicted glutamine amidotransferase